MHCEPEWHKKPIALKRVCFIENVEIVPTSIDSANPDSPVGTSHAKSMIKDSIEIWLKIQGLQLNTQLIQVSHFVGQMGLYLMQVN